MNKENSNKKRIVISGTLALVAVCLTFLVNILSLDTFVTIPDYVNARIFFVITTLTFVLLILNIRYFFVAKSQRLVFVSLTLVTLFSLIYQLSAAIFINFL